MNGAPPLTDPVNSIINPLTDFEKTPVIRFFRLRPGFRERISDQGLAGLIILKHDTGYRTYMVKKRIYFSESGKIERIGILSFAAGSCRKISGQELDPMELLHVQTHTAGEIDSMLAAGNFQQSVHALAWLLYKQQA